MLPNSPDDLIDDCGGGGLNLQGLVDGTSHFVLADSQLDLGFLLHGEELSDEVDQILWSFSFKGAIDYRDGFFGGLEG